MQDPFRTILPHSARSLLNSLYFFFGNLSCPIPVPLNLTFNTLSMALKTF